MKLKTTILLAAAGVISIGLLVFGLITTEVTTPLVSAEPQKNRHESDYWAAASISKETLLALLAVGIAGVLGMSRRRKKLKSDGNSAKLNRTSDP